MTTLVTGRMEGPKALALCRWLLEQPNLADVRAANRELLLDGKERFRVFNHDGMRLWHDNFAECLKMLEGDTAYWQRRPDYRYPFDFRIESDDAELLVWLKMKFL